jgi:hypothetical protein
VCNLPDMASGIRSSAGVFLTGPAGHWAKSEIAKMDLAPSFHRLIPLWVRRICGCGLSSMGEVVRAYIDIHEVFENHP